MSDIVQRSEIAAIEQDIERLESAANNSTYPEERRRIYRQGAADARKKLASLQQKTATTASAQAPGAEKKNLQSNTAAVANSSGSEGGGATFEGGNAAAERINTSLNNSPTPDSNNNVVEWGGEDIYGGRPAKPATIQHQRCEELEKMERGQGSRCTCRALRTARRRILPGAIWAIGRRSSLHIITIQTKLRRLLQ